MGPFSRNYNAHSRVNGRLQPRAGQRVSPELTPAQKLDLNRVNPRKSVDTSRPPTEAELMTKLTAEPWGPRVIEIARKPGVQPLALAATIQMETSFSNNWMKQSSSASALGIAQMQAGAYKEALKTIKRIDPEMFDSLIKDDRPGRLDPMNESVAAMGYLIEVVEYLQQKGIQHPTFLDIRACYNFGPAAGARIARAGKSASMKSILEDGKIPHNEIEKIHEKYILDANGIGSG